MDTLFSDYGLTATRLAELLVTPTERRAALILKWLVADQRSTNRRNYYLPTKKAVEDLHRRDAGLDALWQRVDEMRLDEERQHENQYERDRLRNNIRATTQYLDEHAERQMTVLERRKIEPIVSDVRILVHPHLSVSVDGMAQQLWIDCNTDLHELLLASKCHVTLWAARQQSIPVDQVEVVHSANKRFVTRAKLPPGFAGDVEAICAAFHRLAQQFQREQPLRR